MKKKIIIPVNSTLDQHAKNLRKNMTNEEKTIWYDFLNKITPRFHRQKIIGNYIVDFYCPKLKIVIEIDGVQHYDIANSLYDTKRTQFLEDLGLSVIRFDNIDIKKDFGTVVYDITTHCEEKAQVLGVKVNFPDDV
ncbi:MAG: endonuclease domain-containing protein [Ruminococcaceae bacterium]|nr:endonuclease domain-containing protein [Oscillospiraceae bacterium]